MALLQEADEKIGAGDADGARQVLETIIAIPGFEEWEPGLQYVILYELADQYGNLNQFDKAYEMLVRAGELPPAENDRLYWYKRSYAAMTEDADQSVQAMMKHLSIPSDETMLTDGLIDIYTPVVLDLPDGALRYKQFMEAVYASGYVSDDPSRSPQSVWFELFRTYVREGDYERARALMPFDHPEAVLWMRIDKRYEPLKAELSDKPDYAHAFEQDLLRKQKAVADHPDNLDYTLALLDRLVTLGQLNEAIELATKVTDRLVATDAPDKVWHVAWLYSLRGTAYNLRGDLDEAERDYRLAIETGYPEELHTHKIYLASFYGEQEQNDKALEVISGLKSEGLDDYSRLMVASIVACIHEPQSQDAAYRDALSTLENKASVNYFVAGYGLLCAGAEDELAELIIGGLDDVDTREDVLLYLQDYMSAPYYSPQVLMMEARFKRVVARPEVQAAIARYGAIESLPVYWF